MVKVCSSWLVYIAFDDGVALLCCVDSIPSLLNSTTQQNPHICNPPLYIGVTVEPIRQLKPLGDLRCLKVPLKRFYIHMFHSEILSPTNFNAI